MSTSSLIRNMEKLGGAPDSRRPLRLWLRLLTCESLMEKRMRTRFREQFDITLPRFDVMAALSRAEDPKKGLSMGELSARLLVSNGNVTGIVARLEEEGMVKRSPSAHDRRALLVRLTREGQERFDEMAKTNEGWVEEMFCGMSDNEMDHAMVLLEKLMNNLTSLESQD